MATRRTDVLDSSAYLASRYSNHLSRTGPFPLCHVLKSAVGCSPGSVAASSTAGLGEIARASYPTNCAIPSNETCQVNTIQSECMIRENKHNKLELAKNDKKSATLNHLASYVHIASTKKRTIEHSVSNKRRDSNKHPNDYFDKLRLDWQHITHNTS